MKVVLGAILPLKCLITCCVSFLWITTFWTFSHTASADFKCSTQALTNLTVIGYYKLSMYGKNAEIEK